MSHQSRHGCWRPHGAAARHCGRQGGTGAHDNTPSCAHELTRLHDGVCGGKLVAAMASMTNGTSSGARRAARVATTRMTDDATSAAANAHALGGNTMAVGAAVAVCGPANTHTIAPRSLS